MGLMALGLRPGVSFLRLVLFFLCIGSTFTSAHRDDSQPFLTQGLATLDSPAPQSQVHAGSGLEIEIDLSGNGKLQLTELLLPSSSPRAYQSLNIYLVSSFIGVNLTVSEGQQMFEQEPTSAVKHITWSIPSCLPQGNYNLTFYEASRIDQGSYYSITPIPIVVDSASTAICGGLQQAEPQPQPSSPPLEQPWTGAPLASEAPFIFPTTNPFESGALPTASQLYSSSTLSPPTLSPSPTSVKLMSSTMTVSTTVNGLPTVFTSMTFSPSPSTAGVFFPVNTARAGSSVPLYSLLFVFIGGILWSA